MICNFVTKTPKKKSQKKEQRIKKMLTFASFKRTNDCFTDFKKSKENEEISFYVRSYGCNFIRIMW